MEELKKEEIEIKKEYAGLVCVYGTLRLNQGNWRGYLQDKSDHLGTFRTEPKFTLYGKHMGFPYLCDCGEYSVTCDVFGVYSYKSLEMIDMLEGCYYPSGDVRNTFYDCMEIETPYGPAKMYVIHEDKAKRLDQSRILTSGDWNDKNL